MVFNTLFARSFLLNEGILEGTGFEESEINNNGFGVGMSYSVFAFDRQGQLIEGETYSYVCGYYITVQPVQP